jgi:hypothetical protein
MITFHVSGHDSSLFCAYIFNECCIIFQFQWKRRVDRIVIILCYELFITKFEGLT